jgi:NADPH:quinone reductase-like Zn-dependent oxidoreductase
MGANVAVTAGSQFKLNRCRELGAEPLINYREQDFPMVINAEHSGANVILDIMGGAYLPKNVEALAENGHLTIIGL